MRNTQVNYIGKPSSRSKCNKMNAERIKKYYCIMSIISLFLGFGIYVFFRNSNMLVFNLLPKLEFLNSIYIPIKHTFFNSIFLYNFPDVLWFLSGLLFIRYLWFNNKLQNIYIKCFYGIAIIIETSQLNKNIYGTFDVLDLLFMGMTAFVESLLYKIILRRSLK